MWHQAAEQRPSGRLLEAQVQRRQLGGWRNVGHSHFTFLGIHRLSERWWRGLAFLFLKSRVKSQIPHLPSV